MKLSIMEKYYTSNDSYQGLLILILVTRLFKFRWFTDCGEWFIYIEFGKRWVRFSSAGFMKSKNIKLSWKK